MADGVTRGDTERGYVTSQVSASFSQFLQHLFRISLRASEIVSNILINGVNKSIVSREKMRQKVAEEVALR